LVPTIPTLLRIATVFDVTLDHFFQNEHRRRIISITRKQEREQGPERRLSSDEGYELVRLDLGAGERKFQPYLAEFPPSSGETFRPHVHQGFEFLHILSGALQLTIGSDSNVLRAGDSVYFDSNLRHGYRNPGQQSCVAFMVLAYPERNLSERRMDNLGNLHGMRRQQFAAGNGTFKVFDSGPVGSDAVPTGRSSRG
jgi:quercetin dioxygenase-like cupin family protein